MTSHHHGTVCKTCRRRGKKCDKLLPECSTCVEKGIKCEGYVFKWAGVAIRGKFAGKRIPIADASKETLPPQPQRARRGRRTARTPLQLEVQENQIGQVDLVPLVADEAYWQSFDELFPAVEDAQLPSEDYEPFLQIEVERSAIDLNFTPQPTISQGLTPINVPEEIQFLISYFQCEVSPRLCVDNASTKNPYVQYILPLAFNTPSLLYACAALAACQMDIRSGDDSYRLRSLKFRGKSMKRLQESLYSEEMAREHGTLATVLMLSLCDIALGGFAGFDTHFIGAKKLIDLRKTRRTPDNFVEQYLAWLDTMAATSHVRKPVFSAGEISSWTGSASSSMTRQWSFDVFPCPIEHFEMIRKIVELYKLQLDPSHPSTEVLQTASQYKEHVLSRPMYLEKGEYWLHLTEAYRFAIVLYLLRLFHCGNDADEIAWLTGNVFFHAKATVPLTGWADQMLWPLFHAALEIRDESRKCWLRERSKTMQFSGGFRNVESAMQILETVWAGNSPRNYMQLVEQAGDGTGSIMFV